LGKVRKLKACPAESDAGGHSGRVGMNCKLVAAGIIVKLMKIQIRENQ